MPASYQEWPLPEATLKCVRENGRATFQLEFTWGSPCATHAAQHASISSKFPPSKARGPETNTEEQASVDLVEGGLEGSVEERRLLPALV